MLRWLRRPKSVVPVTAHRPDELVYPFAFPVMTVDAENMLQAHQTPELFGHLSEDSASTGQAPRMSIFTAACRVWRPVGILAMAPTGGRLFGRNIVQATFEFEDVRSFELDELRAAARAAVENDPDDLWDQALDHEQILRAIDAAPTFAHLIDVTQRSSGCAQWAVGVMRGYRVCDL